MTKVCLPSRVRTDEKGLRQYVSRVYKNWTKWLGARLQPRSAKRILLRRQKNIFLGWGGLRGGTPGCAAALRYRRVHDLYPTPNLQRDCNVE